MTAKHAPRAAAPVSIPAPAYRPTPPVTTATVVLPDDSFEVRFEGGNYLCQPPWLGGYSHFDCERYSGGQAPSRRNSDDCSGSKPFPECSELWYPDEIDDYDLITMSSQLHLCKDAFLAGSSFASATWTAPPYQGGEPRQVSFFFALKCSPSGVSLQCEDDYYPSEMKGLRLARIGYTDYVCRETYGGEECHQWHGSGSPKSATYGTPDLYCNGSGTCAEDGYPSGY